MARNKGFSLVEVLIVLVIFGLAVAIGWRVWVANQNANTNTDTIETREPETQDINTDADLDKADQSLDETNLEGTDQQQLDTETSF